jgi:anti-sigma factor RsiW
MRDSDVHLSDRELLLAADGELDCNRWTEAQAHLGKCSTCRERLREIAGVLEDVNHLHQADLDPHIPEAAGARARLQAELRQRAEDSRAESVRATKYNPVGPRALAYACAALFISVVALTVMHNRPATVADVANTASMPGPIPERRLTPGVARPVSNQEICRVPGEGNNAVVPPTVQRAVFQEYGIANARPNDYEVDYLISPALGGTASMGNLWPEPYSTIWNAHVKDTLENRLHELVCEGRVPLATAQHDISTDWISAYKKYFGSDRPLSNGGASNDPRGEPSS